PARLDPRRRRHRARGERHRAVSPRQYEPGSQSTHYGARGAGTLPLHAQPDVRRARRALRWGRAARQLVVATRRVTGGADGDPVEGDRAWGGVSRAQVRGRVSGLHDARAAVAVTVDDRDRAFHVAQFRDYLALEAGNSANTVGNYLRDIARLIAHASTKGAGHPDAITAAQLRASV